MPTANEAQRAEGIPADVAESIPTDVGNSELGHPIEDAPEVDGNLPVIEQQWCRRLVERWNKHHSVGLLLRIDTGRAINTKIGSPDQRQPRGYGVVDTVAAAIGVDAGEISRMRWFAHRVESLKAFSDEHPDVKTWDAVKVWLANEARSERGEDSDTEEPNPVERFTKSLQAATKKLPAEIGEEGKDDLLYELKKFGRKLKKLGVAISITEVDESADVEFETAGSTSG